MSLTEASTWQQIITSMLESLDAIELVDPPSYLIEINAITVDDAVKYSKIKSGLKALAAKGSGITLDEVQELVCYYQWTLEYSTLSVGSTAWQQGLDRFRECLRDPESNLMLSKTLKFYASQPQAASKPGVDSAALQRAIIAKEKLKQAEAARKEKAIKELQQRINEMQQQLDALQNGGGGGVDGGGGTSPTPPADMGGGSGGGGKGGGGGVKVGELELVQF